MSAATTGKWRSVFLISLRSSSHYTLPKTGILDSGSWPFDHSADMTSTRPWVNQKCHVRKVVDSEQVTHDSNQWSEAACTIQVNEHTADCPAQKPAQPHWLVNQRTFPVYHRQSKIVVDSKLLAGDSKRRNQSGVLFSVLKNAKDYSWRFHRELELKGSAEACRGWCNGLCRVFPCYVLGFVFEEKRYHRGEKHAWIGDRSFRKRLLVWRAITCLFWYIKYILRRKLYWQSRKFIFGFRLKGTHHWMIHEILKTYYTRAFRGFKTRRETTLLSFKHLRVWGEYISTKLSQCCTRIQILLLGDFSQTSVQH